MALGIYTDHNVPRSIVIGLRLRQVNVITAYEDDAAQFSDSHLLDRATQLERVLFSQDDDLVKEAVKRQIAGQLFFGVIYAHQLRITIGQCISQLELIAKVAEKEDLVNQVLFLPL